MKILAGGSSFVSFKINSTNKRSSVLIKNIIASFGIKGISIIIQLILVPLTINYVNPTQYGIWLTMSSIVAWFSFFDIGLGNGLRNRFAEAKATKDYERAKAYVSTTYICLIAIFSTVWTSFFLFHYFIDWSDILNTSAVMAEELSVVGLTIFSFFCLQIILKTINTILIADQKVAKAGFLDMLGNSLSLLIIYILTHFTAGSLINLAFAIGVSPVIILLISSLWFFNKDYKVYRPSTKLFDRKIVKDILSLGGKFFFLQLAAVFIYQSTNIIITQILNPENVAIYNISWRYFGVLTMLSSIIFSPFWSAFTDAYKKNDYDWMRNSHKKLKKVAVFLSFGAILLLVLSPYSYKMWIGNSIVVPYKLSIIMFMVVIASIFSTLQFQLLNGMGKLKIQLIVVSVGVFLNIPFSIILGRQIGLIGIILPTLFYNIISYIIYSYQVNLLLRGNCTGIWNK